MREFTDREGRGWIATAREEDGMDYKGRFYLVFQSGQESEAEVEEFPLKDVRWNNERTARRTLETMSVVELRRRLRSALGRGQAPVAR